MDKFIIQHKGYYLYAYRIINNNNKHDVCIRVYEKKKDKRTYKSIKIVKDRLWEEIGKTEPSLANTLLNDVYPEFRKYYKEMGVRNIPNNIIQKIIEGYLFNFIFYLHIECVD